jgi:hypothetical protein
LGAPVIYTRVETGIFGRGERCENNEGRNWDISQIDTTASLHKNQIEQTVNWPKEYRERNHLLDLRQVFGGRTNEAYPRI